MRTKGKKRRKGKGAEASKRSRPVPAPWEVWFAVNTAIGFAYEYERGFCVDQSVPQYALGPHFSEKNLTLQHPEILSPLLAVKKVVDGFWQRRERILESHFHVFFMELLYRSYTEFMDEAIDEAGLKDAIEGDFESFKPSQRKKMASVTRRSIKSKGGASRAARSKIAEVFGYSKRTLDNEKAKGGKAPFGLPPRNEALRAVLGPVFSFDENEVNEIMAVASKFDARTSYQKWKAMRETHQA